jgi:hypothetical protein
MPWDRLAAKDQVLRGKMAEAKGWAGRHEPGHAVTKGNEMYGLNICRKTNIRLRKILKLTNKKEVNLEGLSLTIGLKKRRILTGRKVLL